MLWLLNLAAAGPTVPVPAASTPATFEPPSEASIRQELVDVDARQVLENGIDAIRMPGFRMYSDGPAVAFRVACEGGYAHACAVADAWTQSPSAQALAAWGSARCTPTAPQACTLAAALACGPEGRFDKCNPELDRLCAEGDMRTCVRRVQGADVGQERTQEVGRAACEANDGLGCFVEASVLHDKHERSLALEPAVKACALGNAAGCNLSAALLMEGTKTGEFTTGASSFLRRASRLGDLGGWFAYAWSLAAGESAAQGGAALALLCEREQYHTSCRDAARLARHPDQTRPVWATTPRHD